VPTITEIAVKLLTTTKDELLDAVRTIPPEKRSWKPAETATSAMDILLECAGIQHIVAKVLRDEPVDFGADMPSAEDYATLEALEGYAEETTQELRQAIEAVPEADLGNEITMPWGKTATLAEVLLIAGTHNRYHGGQINYIQLLLGDTGMH
jgi:uncharacterized damage-inducible protein DinB